MPTLDELMTSLKTAQDKHRWAQTHIDAIAELNGDVGYIWAALAKHGVNATDLMTIQGDVARRIGASKRAVTSDEPPAWIDGHDAPVWDAEPPPGEEDTHGFLRGIPSDVVLQWEEQWRKASAIDGGRTYTMLEFMDFWANKETPEVVPGLLPRGEVATVAGPSGVGKSQIGVSSFVACIMGLPWWGRWDIPTLTPLYCLTEAQNGWSKRLQAHLQAAGWTPDNRMGYVRDDLPQLFRKGAYNVSQAGGHDWFLRIRVEQYHGNLPEQLDVVFIDYLRDAATGADEQSNNDMELVMSAVNQLARALDVLIILFHHQGYNTDKPTRGATVVVDKSYAVFTLAGTLNVDDPSAVVTLEAKKHPKDYAKPDPIGFRLTDSAGGAVVEFVASESKDLTAQCYALLRDEYPGHTLKLSQMLELLPPDEGVSMEAHKHRVNRALRRMIADKVSYPGVTFTPGRTAQAGYLYHG